VEGWLLRFVVSCMGRLGELVLLNDLRIYEVANAVIEEFLRDEERVKVLIRRLKL